MTDDRDTFIAAVSHPLPARELASEPNPGERAALLDVLRSGRGHIVFPSTPTLTDDGELTVAPAQSFDVSTAYLVIADERE